MENLPEITRDIFGRIPRSQNPSVNYSQYDIDLTRYLFVPSALANSIITGIVRAYTHLYMTSPIIIYPSCNTNQNKVKYRAPDLNHNLKSKNRIKGKVVAVFRIRIRNRIRISRISSVCNSAQHNQRVGVGTRQKVFFKIIFYKQTNGSFYNEHTCVSAYHDITEKYAQ